ncbi:hypothetical protein [Streptomyces sp. NPDC101237]|uniref:hypothetical protein n=1 Tax=Streptomyces sp. NPDC101237 TaxID=3366139 RepID=UPI0038186670
MSFRRKINLGIAASLLAAGATLGTAQVSEAAPATLSCAYGHFCGADGFGHRFDVSQCGVRVPIGLTGPGEFYNHQTPGTWAHWYNADGSLSGASDAGIDSYIDWTHVWYVQAC